MKGMSGNTSANVLGFLNMQLLNLIFVDHFLASHVRNMIVINFMDKFITSLKNSYAYGTYVRVYIYSYVYHVYYKK